MLKERERGRARVEARVRGAAGSKKAQESHTLHEMGTARLFVGETTRVGIDDDETEEIEGEGELGREGRETFWMRAGMSRAEERGVGLGVALGVGGVEHSSAEDQSSIECPEWEAQKILPHRRQ